MKSYRIFYNPLTHVWDVHKKIMNQHSKFIWVIEKTGFLVKKDAQQYINDAL